MGYGGGTRRGGFVFDPSLSKVHVPRSGTLPSIEGVPPLFGFGEDGTTKESLVSNLAKGSPGEDKTSCSSLFAAYEYLQKVHGEAELAKLQALSSQLSSVAAKSRTRRRVLERLAKKNTEEPKVEILVPKPEVELKDEIAIEMLPETEENKESGDVVADTVPLTMRERYGAQVGPDGRRPKRKAATWYQQA